MRCAEPSVNYADLSTVVNGLSQRKPRAFRRRPGATTMTKAQTLNLISAAEARPMAAA